MYWDLLSRNRRRISGNRRIGFKLKNLDRKDNSERRAIREQAETLKARFAASAHL